MAWMPIAEAAARLGVSERTIWRRIKAESIESRNENGRTLVVFDDPDDKADTVRQLSHVAAAQLTMRKVDADTVAEVLGALGHCREAFDKENARQRRSTRFATALAAVLTLMLGAGVWYHMDSTAKLHDLHYVETASLERSHRDALIREAESVAHAQGEAEAKSDALSALRATAEDYQRQMAAIEESRDALQCLVDERLDELTNELAVQQIAGVETSTDRARLRQTVEALRSALRQKEQVFAATQLQQERITAALHRHAARNAGIAEGLRIHVAVQQGTLDRMRGELSDLRDVLAQNPQARDAAADLALRRDLQASLLADGNASPELATKFLKRASRFVERWISEELPSVVDYPASSNVNAAADSNVVTVSDAATDQGVAEDEDEVAVIVMNEVQPEAVINMVVVDAANQSNATMAWAE